jgi:hypothetical protein
MPQWVIRNNLLIYTPFKHFAQNLEVNNCNNDLFIQINQILSSYFVLWLPIYYFERPQNMTQKKGQKWFSKISCALKKVIIFIIIYIDYVFVAIIRIKWRFEKVTYYSKSRLMLSPDNVIIRLIWSLFIIPFTNAD